MSLKDYPHVTAKIILDSLHPGGPRLTTFELTYPRFIHAEVMTHRQLSRNAQSSRAIPAAKRIQRIRDAPVIPCRWGRNQKGMQPRDEDLCDKDAADALSYWRAAGYEAARVAAGLDSYGLHKQWVNRILEPFDTITTIVTATEWTNFFALRCHPTAQDEFQVLAWKMAELYYEGAGPVLRRVHLPYLAPGEYPEFDRLPSIEEIRELAMISAARCARVSYLNHDGSSPAREKDLSLAQRLWDDQHLSPFEHAALAHPDTAHRSGNLCGWAQFRKMLEAEAGPPVFDYHTAKARYRPW